MVVKGERVSLVSGNEDVTVASPAVARVPSADSTAAFFANVSDITQHFFP